MFHVVVRGSCDGLFQTEQNGILQLGEIVLAWIRCHVLVGIITWLEGNWVVLVIG